MNISLFLNVESENTARNLSDEIIRAAVKNVETIDVVSCEEYWKFDGMYKVIAEVKYSVEEPELDLDKITNKWSTSNGGQEIIIAINDEGTVVKYSELEFMVISLDKPLS
ncbi:MAG TPA: hypothetical protein DCW90_10835 [Lachnospiraceae bacterium]|nr:hypothetical protein [uncultured Lachnoclostridium sp.]HAU85966.1 hypothetical protein [Lachnospiraceae bacterium]